MTRPNDFISREGLEKLLDSLERLRFFGELEIKFYDGRPTTIRRTESLYAHDVQPNYLKGDNKNGNRQQ
jgi:hypothetical protein